MKFLSFKDWFFSQESSAATRSRNAAFWGTGPKIASPFSHSTPHPGMIDKLLKDISNDDEDDNDDDKKKKKKKKKKVDENKGKAPDYSFDAFVRKAQSAKDSTDKEIEDAEEKEKEMDRNFDKKTKEDNKKVIDQNDKVNKKDKESDDEKLPKEKLDRKP